MTTNIVKNIGMTNWNGKKKRTAVQRDVMIWHPKKTPPLKMLPWLWGALNVCSQCHRGHRIFYFLQKDDCKEIQFSEVYDSSYFTTTYQTSVLISYTCSLNDARHKATLAHNKHFDSLLSNLKASFFLCQNQSNIKWSKSPAEETTASYCTRTSR